MSERAINVDEVKRLSARRREINLIDFSTAKFVDDQGRELFVSAKDREFAACTGLTACGLVEFMGSDMRIIPANPRKEST